MQITQTLYVTGCQEWRQWLEENFDKAKEIWLIYPHKDSGKPRIVYNDAVEEALCFGWIDSTIKKFDTQSSAQKFSPRKNHGYFSQSNKERLKWLDENNLIHPSVKESVKNVLVEEFVFPEDILDEIKKDKVVWGNYIRFSEPYKRIRVAYIDSAREVPEEFQKRLANFVSKTRAGKQFGYGGIEKYFDSSLYVTKCDFIVDRNV